MHVTEESISYFSFPSKNKKKLHSIFEIITGGFLRCEGWQQFALYYLMMEAASSFEESVNCTGANDVMIQKTAIFNLFGYQILAIRENIGEYGQEYGLCKVYTV